ncbi:MAG: hypothetical protein JXX29_16635 [Deltaproteobacteria bacterium]|nr:hypothetical protein [Deltaproteobacteria bacterium]MBN2673312.1 hypothetical protein [Deltaproteobacteria bacterium]
MKIANIMVWLACVWGLLGCDALTREEAAVAVEEMALASQAATLVGGTVEISTNFTLGQAADAAAEELAAFYASQLPCAEVTVSGAQISVEYGAVGGTCVYNGQLWQGRHVVTVSSTDAAGVVVQHTWDNLRNGAMSVSGTAEVTWSQGFTERHVVHELQWMRLSDGREGVGSGDRVQQPLNGEWAEGIVINGEREWEGEAGEWFLDIDGVEARWVDAVPQAGTYRLDTPYDKSATLSFEREDEDTILVTLESGKKAFTFRVSQTGVVTGG